MNAHKLFNLGMSVIFALSLVGMPTLSLAQEPPLDPVIGVSPNQGYVYGFGWPNGVAVHMTVQRGVDTIYEANAIVGPCGSGSPALGPCGPNDVYFDISDQLTGTPPVIVQGGDVITLIGGDISRSMTVSILQATGIDINAGTLSGIANPGQPVGVIVGSPQNISAIPDANGNWTAVLGPQYTQPGMRGFGLIQEDGYGNATVQGWSVPQPYIVANANERSIQADERDWLPLALWTAGTQLTLTIDDPSNGVGVDYTTTAYMQTNTQDEDYAAFADFGWPEMGLKPGFIVTISGPQVTKTLVITLDVTDINVQADTVAGVAEAGTRVRVCANVGDNCISRYVTAGEAGTWLADYRNPGSQPDEQQTVDIAPGTDFSVSEIDLDGDEYMYHWQALSNQPPQITSIIAPAVPVRLGQSIDATVVFSDPDVGDTHTAAWDWGDGSTATASATVPSATATHTYKSAGVYTITVQITDKAGASASAIFQYAVIYDPDGGFVTGNGWINSPVGAYTPDPTLTGKATFGFVSKYQKGANVPTGNTEFQFHIANMNFKSTSYDWLVIAGSKAQYKGTGTINGVSNYGFMLTATDDTQDKFRIKIWDKATSQIVYDNMIGAADNADPSTTIEGGSIVIHK
ncbi:MAG: PKD domain-containing protein [Chloroflexi bacterium]|nr:PKD domain-containing protein [Chloroflexota bacterium]